MRNLLNPNWLFLLNTLPVLLLAGLCYAEFSVIQTLLPPASVLLWQRFGLVLGALALATAGYGFWRLRQGRPLDAAYGAVAVLAHVAFLFAYLSFSSEILPRAVPTWMVPTDPIIYVFTFLMLTIAHGMFVLVARLTPDDRPHSAGANFALAFAVPAAWFVLVQLPGWFWRHSYSEVWNLVWGAAFALGTLSFLFFLTRGVYIIGTKKSAAWGEFGVVWKVVIALVLPLLGLAVNNGLLWQQAWSTERGIFGNFSSPWFYALAMLDGLLVCWPNAAGPRGRLAQYLGRNALFGYTFYFFIVFLPFLPLSVVAILAIGVGFLLLAPLLLMMVHLRELTDDYAALRKFYSRRVLVAGLLAGWAVLPLSITGLYLYRRHTLHAALDYAYNPDYSKTYHLDATALAGTLNVVKQHKERSQEFMSSHVPYLSMYFNWLVLDNLTLSDAKIATLEQIFLGRAQPNERAADAWTPPPPATSAVLRGLTSTSTFDARQQAWVSWVNLDVANSDPSQAATEYATELTLPVGCWVGDYYLNIGPRRERGILAEQKAAAWVFAQIVNENSYRDPGLLSYVGPNRVALKVYPVAGREVRRTGLQLLHREPFVLTVDGQRVQLGDSTRAQPAAPVAAPGQAVAYVSAAAKKRLPLVQRRPYYHFLLDVSADRSLAKPGYKQRVLAQLGQGAAFGPARFSLVNTYTTPLPAGTDWQQQLAAAPNEGGFYLDRAIRKTLFDAQQAPAPTYPVLVVVADSLSQAILPADFAVLAGAYPESDAFYVLAADGRLTAHSLRQSPAQPWPEAPQPGAPTPVRAWPDAAHPQAYLPDNTVADIVLSRAGAAQPALPAAADAANRWQAGLLLHGQEQWQTLHPEVTDEARVPFVRASFSAGIMTPATAYLALENDAQKAALQRKQAQVLDGKAALDVDEETTEVPIDEGALLLLLAGVALAFGLLRRPS